MIDRIVNASWAVLADGKSWFYQFGLHKDIQPFSALTWEISVGLLFRPDSYLCAWDGRLHPVLQREADSLWAFRTKKKKHRVSL